MNPSGAPVPTKMPTSHRVLVDDPSREVMRDRAVIDFAQKAYAEFRHWITTTFPLWHASPTGTFLVAMAITYEVDGSPTEASLARLGEARRLLSRARESWKEILPDVDLRDRDATLLHTSVDMLEAWIIRLEGDKAGAVALIRRRLHRIVSSSLWVESNDQALIHCVFLYLIFFACRDHSRPAVNEVIELLDRHHPGWRQDDDLMGKLGARREEFEFFLGEVREIQVSI